MNTERDYELILQKEYESDFVPQVGDKITDSIKSSGYVSVKKVLIYPEKKEIELTLYEIFT